MLSDSITTGVGSTNGGIKQVGGSASNVLVSGDIIEEFLSYQIPVPSTDKYPLYYDTNTSSFVESFFYIPDQTQFAYKFLLQVPFILDVNAYTSGNFNLGSVQAVLLDLVNNNKIIFDTSAISVGFTNMANTGIQIAWLRFVSYQPYKLIGGNPIKLTIKLVGTTTGVGTAYYGYLPMAPDTGTNGIKSIYPAALGIYSHSTPDYNFSVLNDPKYQTSYDYGGIART